MKRRLRGNIITISHYLKGCNKEDRSSFLTRSHRKKTKGNRHQLHRNRFYFLTNFFVVFSVRTVIQWNNLPRDMMESELIEVFEMRLKSPVKNVPGQCYRIVSLGEKVLKGKVK